MATLADEPFNSSERLHEVVDRWVRVWHEANCSDAISGCQRNPNFTVGNPTPLVEYRQGRVAEVNFLTELVVVRRMLLYVSTHLLDPTSPNDK